MAQFQAGRKFLEENPTPKLGLMPEAKFGLVHKSTYTDYTHSVSLSELVWLTDNLIELGTDYDTFPEFNKPRLVGNQPGNVKDGDTSRYYTCKQYNKDTHLCMDYDNRPQFCRVYPSNYGSHLKCPFEGCTHEHNAEVDKNLALLAEEREKNPIDGAVLDTPPELKDCVLLERE